MLPVNHPGITTNGKWGWRMGGAGGQNQLNLIIANLGQPERRQGNLLLPAMSGDSASRQV